MPIRGACPLTGIGRVKWNTLPTHLLKSFILFHLVVDTLLLPVPGPRLSSTLVLEEQMKLEGSCVPRISMWGGSGARSRPLQTGTGMSGGHCWPLTAKRRKVEKPQVMTLLLEHSLVVDLGFSYDKILVFPLPWWRERIIRQVAFILLLDLAIQSRFLNELASWACLIAQNCQIMALFTPSGGELEMREAWGPNWLREALALRCANKTGFSLSPWLKARENLGVSGSLSHWWASFSLSWGFLCVFVSCFWSLACPQIL